jgi:hypothetical protein
LGSKSAGAASGGQQQSLQSGSSGSSTQLPAWLDQASQQAIGTAQTLSQNPALFTPYGGQQVADIAPGTAQSWAQIQNPAATAGVTGGAANTIYNAMAPIQQQQQAALQGGVNQAAGLLNPFISQGPTTAGQVGANAQALMSPYTSSVINPTMTLMQQQLAQNQQANAAAANQVGAFGGSRMGVQNAVLQAQEPILAGQAIGNLLNTGWNQALYPASNIGLQAGQEAYGGAGALGQMGANAGTSMAGLLQGQGMGALSAAQPLQQQYISNLSSMGAQQQAEQQAQLNAQIGNYYAAQQQPMQNLDVLLSAIGGVPYGTNVNSFSSQYGQGLGQQNAYSNPAGSIIGGIGAAGGLASGIGSLASSGALAGLASF